MGLADIIGLALMGIATLRAGVLALPWRALPLGIVLLAVLSAFLPPLYFALGGRNPAESVVLGLPQVLIGLSWVLLGYALWSSGAGGVAQQRSAPAG